MDYVSIAINNFIDNHQIKDLDIFPWMNRKLKEEEISFWIENGYINKKLKRTNKKSNVKLLFLDIDGVLNYSDSKYAIDDICLRNLSKIIKETNAKIILISSWKSGWFKDNKSIQDDDANYLDKRLKDVGIEIYDKSSRNASGRSIEIIDWVMKFNTNSFVILDDDSGHYKSTTLEKHFVKASWYENGLNIELVRKTLELLK